MCKLVLLKLMLRTLHIGVISARWIKGSETKYQSTGVELQNKETEKLRIESKSNRQWQPVFCWSRMGCGWVGLANNDVGWWSMPAANASCWQSRFPHYGWRYLIFTTKRTVHKHITGVVYASHQTRSSLTCVK